MTKEIRLANGKGIALIDDENYEYLSEFSWGLHPKGYARRTKYVNGKSVTVLMHREIMGVDAGIFVDHKDGNKLNNRKNNLRIATVSQNNSNRQLLPTSTSGYKGVTYDPNREKWIAQIRNNGKRTFLGRFSTKEDAAKAYDDAAKELHGDFSSFNFSV